MPQTVVLPGPAPWGFRLSGGIDFNQPLVITRITPGSKAAAANLCPGDVILAIDGFGTESMTHADAQDRIKAAAHQLCLKVDRAETRLWSPQVSEDGKAHPFKINLESEPQDVNYFEHKHNIRPKPFIIPGRSSEPTASVPPESDVYRMLHDNRNEPTQPRQSGSFRVLQGMVDNGSGAVVKARDKYRHPECFVCADCNLNLKQKGYFFIEGELYCETHARARTKPPEGYDTVTLYPKA
uniref:PDZ and LIM domain protein 3 n=1 Tax=Mandrillus leucophaeus TaxID=9568 RepID=A0A2K5YK67_MANLE